MLSFLRGRCIVTPVAVLATVLAACAVSARVATVDGEAITFDEVAVMIPSEGDVVDPQQFANFLRVVITDRVLVAEAERQFEVTRTEAEVDAKLEELVLQSGQTEEEILTSSGLTPESMRLIVAQQVMVEKIIPALAAGAPAPTEEDLMLRYEAILPSVTQVCSSHILLESLEESEDALARARAGENFGDLAVELSVGPSGPNGGDLGCSSPQGYVAEFAAAVLDAEVGTPYGPVETQFGWHVILVSDRVVPSFEEMRDSLVTELQSLVGERLWLEWILEALTTADVTVEPEYGTWTTDPAPTVIPSVP